MKKIKMGFLVLGIILTFPLWGQAAVFMPMAIYEAVQFHPLKAEMSKFITHRNLSTTQKSAVIAKYIPYGITKEKAEQIILDAGFSFNRTPDSIVQSYIKEGIKAKEFYTAAYKRSAIFSITSYGIRLGFTDNKLVYIEGDAGETSW